MEVDLCLGTFIGDSLRTLLKCMIGLLSGNQFGFLGYDFDMCSNYVTKAEASDFGSYGIEAKDGIVDVDKRFYPHNDAPIILAEDDTLVLKNFKFSLVPSWSAESKVKFATYNARIETVLEKATWKNPFLKKHCVVPITGFYESVYDGPFAGNVIRFSRPNKMLLFAAGIYDIWKNASGSEVVKSFSILTTEPSDFILKNGHDRSPIFLDFHNCDEWLHMETDGLSMKKFLLDSNQNPDLEIKIDRALKKK